MTKKAKTKRHLIRVNGHLHEITTHSHKGKVLHKIVSPLMVELHPRDLLQIMIGASILAIPVGFTEETWNLGQTLPLINIIGFLAVSLLFIATFVYYNYYRRHLREHWGEFIKRVFSTYVISFIVVGILLTLIQRTAWDADLVLTFKRIIIVTFPASMSAAIADFLK